MSLNGNPTSARDNVVPRKVEKSVASKQQLASQLWDAVGRLRRASFSIFKQDEHTATAGEIVRVETFQRCMEEYRIVVGNPTGLERARITHVAQFDVALMNSIGADNYRDVFSALDDWPVVAADAVEITRKWEAQQRSAPAGEIGSFADSGSGSGEQFLDAELARAKTGAGHHLILQNFLQTALYLHREDVHQTAAVAG
jgi:hypothetical protein